MKSVTYFTHEDGSIGFGITVGGLPCIHQQVDLDGHSPMNQARAEAVAAQLLADIPDPTPTAQRPELVITAITADVAHAAQALVSPSEVTCPAGTTLTVAGEVRVGGAKVPLDGAFRAPVRASDGRERVVLATITQGVLSATWTVRESGIWEITESLINRDLPEAERMSFTGMKAYVLES